jgi:ribonuclease P protein component
MRSCGARPVGLAAGCTLCDADAPPEQHMGDLDEADIPTVKPASPPHAWVSQKDEHSMGTGCPEEETAQGARPPDRVAVGQTFSKQERIRRRKDFLAVYTKGRKSAHGGLALHVRPTDRRRTRLGLSVGRSVGHAVERNQLKRRLREIFRLCKHLLEPGYDVVITVRRDAASRSYRELEESLTTLLKRLGLFRPNPGPGAP